MKLLLRRVSCATYPDCSFLTKADDLVTNDGYARGLIPYNKDGTPLQNVCACVKFSISGLPVLFGGSD